MSDTATFTHDDMIRKVAALLDTAESYAEQGNDEAAQSYVQKAHALQQKYSIDQAMLAERTGQKVEKIISKDIVMPGKYGKRKVTLAHVIAHATSCTGYFHKMYPKVQVGVREDGTPMYRTNYDTTRDYYYTVFGFESDVEHVEFMLNSLASQMDDAHQLAVANKPYYEHGKTFGASFMEGFTNTIGYRLREANRQAKAEAKAQYDTATTSTDLVLVDKKKQVEAEMRSKVGRLGKGTASTVNSSSGYNAGRQAGYGATIARGSVGGSSRGSLGR
jgi:hypothetical protein